MTAPGWVLLWAAAGGMLAPSPKLPTPGKGDLAPSLKRLLEDAFKVGLG